MEYYNSQYNEMSNATINLKLKEIGIEYDYIKQEILKFCDKLEVLEKEYKRAKEELKKRGVE